LTSVDPGNFPTALTALTALNTVVMWLVVIPTVLLVMSAFYAEAMSIAGVQEEIGPIQTPGISRHRWGFRAFGALSLAFICMAAFLPTDYVSVRRAGHIVASNVLVAAAFSYDQTCAVSNQKRLVARLKDFKEWKTSIVSIAEDHGAAWWIFPLFQRFTFSRGTCDDQPRH
jgi:hypothetical protein